MSGRASTDAIEFSMSEGGEARLKITVCAWLGGNEGKEGSGDGCRISRRSLSSPELDVKLSEGVVGVKSEDSMARGGVGRDVVVAAKVKSRGKLWRTLIVFSEEDFNGVEDCRETSKGMPGCLLAANIYSQATLLRAQSAVLVLHKEATIVNLHNSTCYS